ncbi:hypothetical protein JXO59_06490 [candidate division KSB1 bacterium]|nr:hypothetical protein [candidate division KSB1 bacterium]
MKRTLLLTALLFIGFWGLTCTKSFSPAAYFPLKLGYTWFYSGLIHTMEVTEVAMLQKGEQYTIAMYDSSETILCKETYLLKGKQIYWTSFQPDVATIPNIYFEPAIPIAPISDKIGETFSLHVFEKRDDGTGCRVRVTGRIEDAGSQKTGIGTFADCIKMHLQYEYLDEACSRLLAGSTYYWYARDVGIIRFEMPSGEGELSSAKFNNRPLFP